MLPNTKQNTRRTVQRIAIVVATALFAISLKCEASAAYPLFSSALRFSHDAVIAHSLLLEQHPNAALPLGKVTVSDTHSLLTTPKTDSAPASAVEPLTISTQVRTHRLYTAVAPAVRISADMAPGVRKVLRRGKASVVVVTERVTQWSGVVVDRHPISRVVVQRAQPGLIVEGPPRTIAEAMAATNSRGLIAVYAMVSTAYTADSASATPTGRTATGIMARYGVVAVDPHVIPLGSQVFIPGYGTAIAADTGGAIIGNRIDLCMDSLHQAIQWGRQPVKVYILRNR